MEFYLSFDGLLGKTGNPVILIFVPLFLVATLLAFILAPIVDFLGRFRVPRALSSLFAVLIFMGLIYGITYASYNEAVNFVQVFPKYSERIRTTANSMRERAESLNPFRPATEDKNVIKVQPSSPVTELVTRGFSSFSQAAFVLTFVPFLIYFMLSWQQHVRSATVMLFRMEHRHTAYVTLGLISRMIRSFMVGNLLIGLLMAAVSVSVFGALHLPFFLLAEGEVAAHTGRACVAEAGHVEGLEHRALRDPS